MGLSKRAARLAACATAEEAVSLFDEVVWELVLEAHDEDMRSGGLERIFPTAQSAKYLNFMGEESYHCLVLRRFYEAGGAEIFKRSCGKSNIELPAWIPRQVC